MTPYRELHTGVDLELRRRKKPSLLSTFYKRQEDVPTADQNANFGETFVPGATPNWSFPPSSPTATYSDGKREGNISRMTVALSGGPGSPPFIPDLGVPNIDWEYVIEMERKEELLDPYIRITLDGTHNLYPAYEVIVQESDGDFVPLYQIKPHPDVLPGPNSLNTTMEVSGSPIDVD